ncbi:MAG: polysaccharide deacetylase family protein [Armatimonadota bacterium]|nr:polysaccharide deacetylase family protein [Armatimonadota bacterium]
MTNRIKRAGGQISAALYRLFGSRAGNRFGILMYHRIAPESPGMRRPTRNVTPDQFEKQMEGLVAAGYHAWPLDKVIEACRAGRNLPAKTFVITFDDGFQNVYLNAWPVLQRLGLSATIFMAAAYADNETPFPFDRWGCAVRDHVPSTAWAPLSWEECREMEASGLIRIGSHTHTHRDFRGNPDEFRQDVFNSLVTIRNHLGNGSYPFAFPFGGRKQGFFNQTLLKITEEAELTCALTTEIGLVSPCSSPFGWGRFEAVQSDTPASLQAKLAGWYDWMGSLREGWRMVGLFLGAGRPRAGE